MNILRKLGELIFRPVRCPRCGYAVEYCECKGEDYNKNLKEGRA